MAKYSYIISIIKFFNLSNMSFLQMNNRNFFQICSKNSDFDLYFQESYGFLDKTLD